MKRYFLFFLLIGVFPHIAFAVPDSTGVNLLGEVLVYGSRTIRDVIPVQTLSGDELQRLSVHSVADAVRYFSGVQIKDYGGIGGLKTVNIRSMGTQHTGVFYDGIELGNAQNGVIDLGRFSLENMESISLYNGQKSAIFQPAKDFSSAGSIYLTTRTPLFEGKKTYNLRAKLKSGSFGTVNPAILWEQRLNETTSSSFNVEYMYTTGKYSFSYRKKNGYDTTEVRRNGDVYALRLEHGLSGKILNGEWKTKLYFYNSERGYPGAAVREEPGMFRHQDRQWDTDLFFQSSFKKSFGKSFDLLLNGKYAYDYLHYMSDPRLDVTTMYVDNRYKQQEIYFSSANRLSIYDFWSVNLSADFQMNTLDADLTGFSYPNRLTGLVAAATALYFPRFKMQASILGTYVHETVRPEFAAADDRKIYTPTVALSWQPLKVADLNLRAFYKRIFRMPTLNDLYYTFIGNKNLNPEYATQYNIGATYLGSFGGIIRETEIRVDAYYNEVTDKIIAMPASNQFRWTMVNLGLVKIHGIDATMINSWQIFRALTINTRFAYTYQQARNFTDSGSSYYGHQIPYIPLHSGSLTVGGNYRNWDFNYSFIYTGERYNAGANIPENYEKPWYTSDMSLTKTFKLKSKTIKLTAEINNLFNQQYEVVRCYPMPGTNVYFIANVSF